MTEKEEQILQVTAARIRVRKMEQRLEKVGANGSETLRVTLITCTDPIATINEWQAANSIQLDSLESALPLLDLHQIRRVDFHQSVVNELRSKLLETINELATENSAESNDRLDKLLRKLFTAIQVEALRDVVLELLRVVKQPPPEMLIRIREMTEVFRKECPIALKRRIWEVDEASFQEELASVLEPAIMDRTAPLIELDLISAPLGTPGKCTDVVNLTLQLVYFRFRFRYSQLISFDSILLVD